MERLLKKLGLYSEEISADAAYDQIKQKARPLVLDVRQPEEYAEAHIAGAQLIPLGELSRRLSELPKDKPIICVCRSGNRSGSATRQLAAAGYQVTNLRGGMLAWQRAGLPVKQGRA